MIFSERMTYEQLKEKLGEEVLQISGRNVKQLLIRTEK